jgi:hypothetical protein
MWKKVKPIWIRGGGLKKEEGKKRLGFVGEGEGMRQRLT